MKIIAIEEHVLDSAVAQASAATLQQLSPYWGAAFGPASGLPYTPSPDVLRDLDQGRIADMDTRLPTPRCGHRRRRSLLLALSGGVTWAARVVNGVVDGGRAVVQRITSRNARFQQWEALLTNRTKRQRSREFLVQGVRPITIAVEQRWSIHTLIYDSKRTPSRWAQDLLDATRAEQVAMSPDLLAELGEKNETAPEVIAVMEIPEDDLDRIDVGAGFLGVLFDRPTSPGNIGSIIRSADAFGADGVIVTGHAADVYDSKCVRASTGSIFSLPTVRVPSHREVMAWLDGHRERGRPVQVVGTDEQGDMDIFDFDLTKPTLLLIGNETAGLSAAWRDLCDRTVSIPMTGTASSLNAASAATAVLYEASRQRIAAIR